MSFRAQTKAIREWARKNGSILTDDRVTTFTAPTIAHHTARARSPVHLAVARLGYHAASQHVGLGAGEDDEADQGQRSADRGTARTDPGLLGPAATRCRLPGWGQGAEAGGTELGFAVPSTADRPRLGGLAHLD